MSNMNDVPVEVLAGKIPATASVQTVGWLSQHPGLAPYIFTVLPARASEMKLEEVIIRKDAEEAFATLKDEHDERSIDIDVLTRNLNDARAKIAELCRPQNRFLHALRILVTGK